MWTKGRSLGVTLMSEIKYLLVLFFCCSTAGLKSVPFQSITLGSKQQQVLTVPTIVIIAHTFCASRDTRISYRRCLLIHGYFCAVQNCAEKAELSKRSWYPERKLGLTMHFSEIIKL